MESTFMFPSCVFIKDQYGWKLELPDSAYWKSTTTETKKIVMVSTLLAGQRPRDMTSTSGVLYTLQRMPKNKFK
jgi:hypothetical protein